jgi:hypothetical protein
VLDLLEEKTGYRALRGPVSFLLQDEVHLDRKLERMLTILIRLLQNLRRTADPG